MKCEKCQEENKTSRILNLGGVTTDMAFYPYRDKEGRQHYHDENSGVSYYECSNGHSWNASLKNKCPTCGYDW